MNTVTVTLSASEAVKLAELRATVGYASDADALRGALQLAHAQASSLKPASPKVGMITMRLEKSVPGEKPMPFPKLIPGVGKLDAFDHLFPDGTRWCGGYLDASTMGKLFK